jgi:hypothetical protein
MNERQGVGLVKRSDIALAESGGLALRNLAELSAFASMIERTAFCPPHFKGNTDAIAVAIQFGLEIGLRPLQALREVKIIEGQPGVWSDAMLALVMASGLLEDIDEHFEGDGDEFRAVCITKRRGHTRTYRTEFSVKDAKVAGLWAAKDNWRKYPRRLMTHRARTFNLRDRFGDVVRGIVSLEEAQDAEFEVLDEGQPKPTLAERIRAAAPLTPEPPVGEFIPEPEAAAAPESAEPEPVGPEPGPEPDRAAEAQAGAGNKGSGEPQEPATARRGTRSRAGKRPARRAAPVAEEHAPEPPIEPQLARRGNFCPRHGAETDDTLVRWQGEVMCVKCARQAAGTAPQAASASLATAAGRSAFRQSLEKWNAETQPIREGELPAADRSADLFDEQGADA